jgi:hypothetical protein
MPNKAAITAEGVQMNSEVDSTISSVCNCNSMLVFLAVPGTPVSLWFLSALIRIGIVMIALPGRWERERRKPVLVAE